MKIYKTLDVKLTYQNFGSTWALILRGKTEDIEVTTNGLYNWGVTNGDVEYFNHVQTVGVVWTDEKSIRRFFYLQSVRELSDGIEYRRTHTAENRVMGKLLGKRISELSHARAERKIRMLRRRHENFFDFANAYAPDAYDNGQISAERPDSDMKDAIISHAYASQED